MARGANHKGKGVNLLFWPKFPKNCMKMKRMGGGGVLRPWRSLGLANWQWGGTTKKRT